jgi:DNA-nicking Smr family endonuclease
MSPERALRRLSQELHACRVAGLSELRVITGRGWGNRAREPILRGRVEAWLRGPEGSARGVRGLRRVARGGALEVRLAGGGGAPSADAPQARGGPHGP